MGKQAFLWLWDKIAGNLIWAVILFVVGAIYAAARLRWPRWKSSLAALLHRPSPVVDSGASISMPFYFLSIVLLGLAIILLALWLHQSQKEMKRLKVQMLRYVLPRALTKDQIQKFGEYLRTNSKPKEIRIRYALGNAEAQSYAEDFANAFRAGNWFPTYAPINPTVLNCQPIAPSNGTSFHCATELAQVVNNLEGVVIQQTGPNPPQPQTVEEKLNPHPYLSEILGKALAAAEIEGVSSGYSLTSDPPETVTVFVGSRRRDRAAVTPKIFRNLGQMPEVTDDDFFDSIKR